MGEIGVRELRATLSKVLRRVEQGERFRVMRRGRPVADLVPATPAGSERYSEHMRRLISEGKVTPASRPLPPAPPLIDSPISASAIVLAEREEER